MLDKYPEIRNFLDRLVNELQLLLEDDLLGIYLTGSITVNAYIDGISDIDVIAVLKNDPDETRFQKLEEWANRVVHDEPESKYLDISFVNKDNVSLNDENKPKTGIEFWKGKLAKSDNTIGDNLIVWNNILNNGIVLFGVDPHVIINNIPYQNMQKVMIKELGDLRKILGQGFEEDLKLRYYVITTLCRLLHIHANKFCLSKKEALEWYGNTYHKHGNLLEAAGSYMTGKEELIAATNIKDYTDFLDEAESIINN